MTVQQDGFDATDTAVFNLHTMYWSRNLQTTSKSLSKYDSKMSRFVDMIGFVIISLILSLQLPSTEWVFTSGHSSL